MFYLGNDLPSVICGFIKHEHGMWGQMQDGIVSYALSFVGISSIVIYKTDIT